MIPTSNAFKAICRIPYLNKWISRFFTHLACSSTAPRPRAFSLWSHVPAPKDKKKWGPVGEYTCWPMLVDKSFSGRHLPPAPQSYVDSLPDDPVNNLYSETEVFQPGQVTSLFRRKGAMTTDRSSLLFMFFAQWFTDSVLRIDPNDRRKNTSNHNIDLCQIYGLKEDTTRVLRAGEGGRLRSQIINGEEFPDHLGYLEVDLESDWKGRFEANADFKDLPYANKEVLMYLYGNRIGKGRRKLYATGLERGNSSVGYAAISIIFMREHNRICKELHQHYPTWDDERLFQTARIINIVILMKLVVEEYINHIVGYRLFHFDPSFAEKKHWYRSPWISLEFDLLYRWHGMAPGTIEVKGDKLDDKQFLINNELLEAQGLNTIVAACSQQRAGKIGLGNVPDYLLRAEHFTLSMARKFRLQPYNEYRRAFQQRGFGLKPLRSFSDLTDDPALQLKLWSMYKHVDQVEFVVGLFAEKPRKTALFGDLLGTMVAYDAFTQIYTNPLLSKNVYNEQTFTPYGMDLIAQTRSVQDLVSRNGIDARAGFNA